MLEVYTILLNLRATIAFYNVIIVRVFPEKKNFSPKLLFYHLYTDCVCDNREHCLYNIWVYAYVTMSLTNSKSFSLQMKMFFGWKLNCLSSSFGWIAPSWNALNLVMFHVYHIKLNMYVCVCVCVRVEHIMNCFDVVNRMNWMSNTVTLYRFNNYKSKLFSVILQCNFVVGCHFIGGSFIFLSISLCHRFCWHHWFISSEKNNKK